MRTHLDPVESADILQWLSAAEKAAGPLGDMTLFGKAIADGGHDEQTLAALLVVACDRHDVSHVQTLLSLGAKPDIPCPLNGRPIQYAAARGRADMLRALLDAGADPDAGLGLDNRSSSPIREAIRQGSAECARLLASRGADIESYDQGHWSAFVSAASRGQVECLAALAQAGADTASRTHYGLGALEVAASNNFPEAIEALTELRAIHASQDEIHDMAIRAAENGYFQTLRALSRSIDIDEPQFSIVLEQSAIGEAAEWLRCRRESKTLDQESAAPASPRKKRATI